MLGTSDRPALDSRQDGVRSVRDVIVDGVGLHGGHAVRVTLRPAEGPVRLTQGSATARIDELAIVATARATTVEAHGGRLHVGTIEHLFAALAGLGVYEGVDVHVEGPELPLLDGGASAWCDALCGLDLVAGAPRLRVARPATIHVGASRYDFAPGAPGCGVDVSVRFEVDDPRLAADARWLGDPRDFATRVAPARTFALAADVDELARRGLARHVDPRSVVLVAPDAIHAAGRSFSADEPARHKLLDWIGDLYVHGGPPVGRVHAVRPGHAANAEAIARAVAEGVLERREIRAA